MNPMITVGAVSLRPRGGRLSFEIALQSIWSAPQQLAVDLAVESPDPEETAVRRKVFELGTLHLDPAQAETLCGSVAIAPLASRPIVPGRHHLDLLVNGVAFPLGGFSVVPRRAARRRR